MSLASLYWANGSGSDVHLLPGFASPELFRLLRAGDADPATGDIVEKQLHQMSGLSVAFAAQLAGTLASHGLTMNDKTGEVSVDANAPPAILGHSFLITATATQGTATASTRIRVCVHGVTFHIWLTPSRLTVRKGAQDMRFSVLAQFDDLTIGDITNWSPFEPPMGPPIHTYVHAAGSDDPALVWSAEALAPGGTAPVGTHPVTGVLDTSLDNGTTSKITVRRGTDSASATAVCAPAWSTPVKVALVAGPGVKEMNFVRNILFLPDGFKDSERPEFERQVRRVVARWSLRNRTRPFASLDGKINYFMAWLPSPDAGVSVLDELDLERTSQAVERARSIEMPGLQRPTVAKWTLDRAINEIGLPTLLNDPDNAPLDAARIQAWQSLYGTQVTNDRIKDVYPAWRARNDRILLNEVDTAFHMAFGERPAVDQDLPGHALRFNRRRMADHDFGTFLDALTGPAGQMLSKVWTTGKDNRLVVILCRSNHVGGSAGELVYDPNQDPGGVIGVSLGVNLAHQVDPRPHDEGWDLHPDTFPADPHYSVWLTAAHEIGHACGLGEEYADTADPPTAARIADTLKRPNNQARGTLLNAAGELRSENIRWAQWPRIAKAAALLGPPLPQAGGRFLLACAGKATPPFAIGDIVRLRTRPLALSKGPSGRLEVESIAADGLSLLVVPLPAVVLDPAAFPGDSIVMMPVRAHDPNAAAKQYGDDIGMVTDDVLLRINFSNNPLNARPMAGEAAAPNDPANRPCPNVELPVPTPATNFPGGAKGTPKPPLFSSWIIGLYENANRHRCGIYRPTGVCIMNTQARVSAGTVYQYEYCQVCRYAIVDQLDPSGHAGVEQDYRDRYL